MNERVISPEWLVPDYTIGILGPIGSGKSTLSEKLAGRLGIPFVEEDFGHNPHLGDFYKNPSRFAYISQTWFLTRKIEQLRSITGSAVIDPDKEMDKLFAKLLYRLGYMDAREWDLYEEQCAVLEQSADIKGSDIYIVVDAPTPILVERVKRRGRSYELLMLQNFPDYIDILAQTVRDWADGQSQNSVIRIDTGDHDVCTDKECLDIVEKDVINLLLQKIK